MYFLYKTQHNVNVFTKMLNKNLICAAFVVFIIRCVQRIPFKPKRAIIDKNYAYQNSEVRKYVTSN